MHIYYGESISLTKNNSKENMIEIFWSDLVTSYSQAKESISSWWAIQLDEEEACWYTWMAAVQVTLLNDHYHIMLSRW